MPVSGGQILEDLNVVVQKGDFFKTCRVKTGRKYSFGKKGEGQFTLNMDGAVGMPFGSFFKMELVSQKLYNIRPIEENTDSLDLVTSGGEDNRSLCDDGCSQKLTPEEIMKLKSSGLTGKEVVQTITDNSSTFKEKTVYSQQKYVNKKHKKYDEVITIHKPSIRLLCKMYYQDPMKISNLRIDTLSQILCYSNVQAGGRFAVFESGTLSLVTAAILHRMGSTGHLVHVYHGSGPERDALDLMNFTTSELEVVSFINFSKLPDQEKLESVENGSANPQVHDETEKSETEKSDTMSSLEEETGGAKEPSMEGVIESNKKEEKENPKDDVPTHQTAKSRIFVRKQVDDIFVSSSVLRGGIEGLVVACRQHPVNITIQLLRFLKPGHPFVVFSRYKEPLIELYSEIKSSSSCANLRLSETWLRHYQVLDQRTHPEVNMSGGGGYLLYGTRISRDK